MVPVVVVHVATTDLLPVVVNQIVKVVEPVAVIVEVPEIALPPDSVNTIEQLFWVVVPSEAKIVGVTVNAKLALGVVVLEDIVMLLKAVVPVTVKEIEEPAVYADADAIK